MVETSCPSRDDTEGILLVVSEQTRHTGIPFLCYEDTRIRPGIRDARHQSFSASTQPSQTRHARPKRTDFMGEKQTHIRQSPVNSPDRSTTISLNPPDCATTISRLITNGRNDRRIIIANQYPHNPSSVVEKNERCYDVCL